jgi:ParB-like partition proteins
MMATKRTSFVDLLPPGSGSSPAGGERPGPPPITALLHTIVGNPANPRDPADYTTANDEFREMQETFRTVGQLQPIAVVSRAVFVRHHPEHADAVAAADWVVVMGNRRLAVARSLGWTKVDIRVQDHLGDGDGTIREAVIIENGQRRALDPCKEAVYLADLVKKYGSQEAVAEKIGKSQMYVSNRIALLGLAPELQDLTDRRAIRIKLAEQLAKLETFEEQRAAWEEDKQRAVSEAEDRKQVRAERKARRLEAPTPAVPAPVPVQNPVLKQAPERSESTGPAAVQNPVLKPAGQSPAADLDAAPVRAAAAVPGQQQAGQEPVGKAAALPGGTGAGEPRPRQPGEPEWAVGKSSPALTAARGIVERFGPDDRRVIVRFLAGVEEVERSGGETEASVHKT